MRLFEGNALSSQDYIGRRQIHAELGEPPRVSGWVVLLRDFIANGRAPVSKHINAVIYRLVAPIPLSELLH
jgi:hypothetical protein